MKENKELFVSQAEKGYTVCYADQCPLRAECLRWMVGRQMPGSVSAYRCVNLRHEGVATAACPLYRSAQKARFAKGMLHTFTSDMPKRLEQAVRLGIISRSNRTYYFEYRNGSRLLSPAMQDHIRQLFRDNGWASEVAFDSYVEAYDW